MFTLLRFFTKNETGVQIPTNKNKYDYVSTKPLCEGKKRNIYIYIYIHAGDCCFIEMINIWKLISLSLLKL